MKQLKQWLCMLLSVVMMFSLTACGKDSSVQDGGTGEIRSDGTDSGDENSADQTDGADGEIVTIKFMAGDANAEEIVALFEAQNPNIKVDYEVIPTIAEYHAKMATLIANDDIPDIFSSQAPYYLDYVQKGICENLTDALNTENYEGDMVWRETFIPSLLENATLTLKSVTDDFDTLEFGVPVGMISIAVLYNKTVFDELGLAEPENYEAFLDNNEVLKEAGYIPFSMTNQWADWLPRLYWDQFCRDELDTNPNAFEDGTMSFQSESVRAGLTATKEMWDRGYLPEAGLTATIEQMQQAFMQGELAQFILVPSDLKYIHENLPDDMEVATFAFPGIEGLPERTLGGASSIANLSAHSEHKEEALLFLKYLASKTYFSEIDTAKYNISGLVNTERDPEIEALCKGYTDAANGGFCPDVFVPTNVTPELSDSFLNDLLPNYLLGTYDLDEVCEKLQNLYQTTYLDALE